VFVRYIIWENLESLLLHWNPADPVYLGRRLLKHIPHGYAAGGAGYVLSNPAIRKVVNEGSQFRETCHPDGAIEDLDIGRLANGAFM